MTTTVYSWTYSARFFSRKTANRISSTFRSPTIGASGGINPPMAASSQSQIAPSFPAKSADPASPGSRNSTSRNGISSAMLNASSALNTAMATTDSTNSPR